MPPKMLRCVEYYVGSGNDYLSSYSEYTYDEQGNCIECEEYKRNDDEWVHFRHTEFTYDSQGRIQEKRSHTFSDLGDVDDTMTQIESAPDHVALNFGTSGSREVYYYNDMGQCVREEFDGGGSYPYWYKTYAYDSEGKITEANLYYPSEGTGEEYTFWFGSSDRYTLFPVGCSGTPAGTGYDSTRVNLEYLYTGGGAMNIIYYADPIS